MRRLRNISRALHTRTISDARALQTVTKLSDWSVTKFRQHAFKPQLPAHLPALPSSALPAFARWFDEQTESNGEGKAELRYEYFKPFQDAIVPLEVTKTETDSGKHSFHRDYAPLKILLDSIKLGNRNQSARIYLAQCQLQDLPLQLRQDLPTPDVVLYAGKGDIYDTNLWMGLPPTNTPLHRDPNPNLFLQLSGQKTVRLYPPEVGASILDCVQQKLGIRKSTSLRGEEMMHGKERLLLDDAVWNPAQSQLPAANAHCQTTILNPREALFIPLGWWHSIKGFGNTVNTSVNFWFR